MFYFSKSKYTDAWRCPKMVWLDKFKPEVVSPVDPALQSRFDTGNEVGDLAMGLFGDFVEVTAHHDDGKLDLSAMIEATRVEMERGTQNICEASFCFDGLYCAVDILRREGGGWAIYEVKSSTHPDNTIYHADVAYQKYILENCGVTVTGTFLVNIDSSYVFDGTLDLHALFKITDVAAEVAAESANVESILAAAQAVLSCEAEPTKPLSLCCKEPYECKYCAYCWRDVPSPSVFDLYRLDSKVKFDLYRSGYASLDALAASGFRGTPTQMRQIDFATHDRGTHVDAEAIGKYLDTLTYPLYFLDFETMQMPIPKYVGTKPYQQIPFQYSLHYVEREGGELCHREFLAEPGCDPRRAIAERLCEDIPRDVCVTAYNKSFECGQLAQLAEQFPDLAEHLLNIRDNVVDLIVPFRSGWYYNAAMVTGNSIKIVLPAMFPDDPELDYHNLDDVHNGTEAMTVFPAMEHMLPEERERTRQNLLRYCELDTYAMVKLWQGLRQAAGR